MQPATQWQAERDRILSDPEANQALQRFEQALFAGEEPRIEDFQATVALVPFTRQLGSTANGMSAEQTLPPAASKRMVFVEELLHIEIEYRTKQGKTVSLDHYLRRFPELAQNTECLARLWETVKKYDSAPETVQKHVPAGTSPNGDEKENLVPTSPADVPTAPLPGPGGAKSAGRARTLNRQFGDYELLNEIARGGMGVVYKARQIKLHRLVALKMILAGQLAGPEHVVRFYNEAEAAAQLDHPGIVPIFEVGLHEGQHFFSMGFVDGQSLAQRVARGPLPHCEAAQLVFEVAQAVQYAHEKGVIHRDLKPGNILLDMAGKPRVTDFGLAKLTEHKTDLTGTGQVLGTPSYMPPEQASGKANQIGQPADVYALGAVLYCLVTGRPPFQAASAVDTLMQVIKQDPVPIRQLNSEVPLDLETIALKCLEKEIPRRYGSARLLADELKRFLNGEPILARPVSAVERTWRWCQRNRLVAGLAATAAFAGLAFVVVVSVALVLVNAQKERAVVAEAEAKKQKTEADLQKEAAFVAEADAKKQKEAADEQRMQAENAKTEADNQRMQADSARQQAELAEKQQAYEAYIAQIGLAAAKIDENAFDSARDILTGCKEELRNWEWRRLSYLCGLSEREVDAEQPIEAVAFSKDGTRFITGGWNRTAKIWDTATGTMTLSLPVGGMDTNAVAFSPDGRFVATGGDDELGFVRVWNVEAGKPEPIPAGFKGSAEDELKDGILSIMFSRDGTKLLTSSYDKMARLWDVKTGRQVQIYKGHSWFVWSAAFSPDETQIVTASQDGSVVIWNTETATREKQFLEHEGPVYSAAFAPDGKHVVSGGYDKKVLVWRPQDVPSLDLGKLAANAVKTEEGKDQLPEEDARKNAKDKVPVLALEGHGGPVRSVSFSTDGKLVLSGSHDNSVKIWDAELGKIGQIIDKPLKTLHGHGSWVRACRFSPDDRIVLSASHDKKAMLWNIADYKELRVLGRLLQGHGDAVLAAAFDQAGHSIVTASRDRTARIWNFETGAPGNPFREGHELLATNAAFFPDGKNFLTAAVDNTVRFWDVATGTQIARLDKTGRAGALALAPSGKRILTGSDEKTARLWDAATRRLIKELKESHKSKYEITAVAISPDERWLLTADANGRAVLWNAETLEVAHSLTSHTGKVTAAVFLPDSARLLTASSDKTVAQWDVATGKEILPLVLKHPEAVVALALVGHRDKTGHQVLTTCADGTVRLWDLAKAQVVGTLPLHSKVIVNAVSVSLDGRLALTVQSEEQEKLVEKVVRLWDVDTLREIKVPQGKNQSGAFLDFSSTRGIPLSTAIFSPDGNSILTVGGDEARLWDRQKAIELISFNRNDVVAAAAFSPDASRIVTGSWDNAARVWDTKTGVAIMKLEGHRGPVNSAAYSPDGTFLLTGSDDRTASLWHAATGRLIREFTGHADRINSAAFSADGKWILTASADTTARIWSTETAQELGRFEGHKFGVLSAVFSADGKKIVTGSEDNTARVWDVATRKMLLSLESHTAPVASVAIFPDGQRVLTGSHDNTAKLWDAVTGKEILTLRGHVREVTCVNVSKNGRYALTGSRDGTAIVWLAVDSTIHVP